MRIHLDSRKFVDENLCENGFSDFRRISHPVTFTWFGGGKSSAVTRYQTYATTTSCIASRAAFCYAQ